MTLNATKGTKALTWCQLVVASSARKEKRGKRRSYWTTWGKVTSIASQAGAQISRARSGAAGEPTAGAPRNATRGLAGFQDLTPRG